MGVASHLEGEQVLDRLATDGQPRRAAGDDDQGRPHHAVVVRGHREVVGAGGEHADDVTADGLYQDHVLGDAVAALAAPSRHGAAEVRLGIGT